MFFVIMKRYDFDILSTGFGGKKWFYELGNYNIGYFKQNMKMYINQDAFQYLSRTI